MKQGGILLPATGYIQVHAFAGKAQLPLEDVTVAIVDTDRNLIATRLTNKSGLLDEPIPIEVPDRAESRSPDPSSLPFTQVIIYARLEKYEQIEAENVQIFADVITVQNLEMIPLSELPESWTNAEIFDTPSQNL